MVRKTQLNRARAFHNVIQPLFEGLENRQMLSQTPFGGIAAEMPGTIAAVNYDLGGEGVAYHDTDSTNAGGVYRSDGVDIKKNSDGSFRVGNTLPGEWLEYTINVKTSGTYKLDARVAAQSTTGRFHVEVDGVDKTGQVAVPNTGAWEAWGTVSKTGINLSAGTHVMRFYVDSGGFNLRDLKLTAEATTPAAPSGLTATAVSSSQIDLKWNDNSSNETGFKIERKTGSTGTWTQIATMGSGITTYCSTGLISGTQFFYRVRATNTAGDSGYTAEASATTAPATTPTVTVPVAPSGLMATTASSSQINLKWNDNSSNETGFKIERKTGSTGTWTQIATMGSGITTYSSTGLTAGTTYVYRVRATNTAGDSGYTAEASATTTSATTQPTTRPGPGNTGPTNPSILRASGSITVTTPGAIIENVNVTGTVVIKASNVILRNFKVNANGAGYGIRVTNGARNVLLEDGEVINGMGCLIDGAGFTARRLNLHESGADGINPTGDVTVEDSWIHHLGKSVGSHADGIQIGGGSNYIIRNNTIDMPINQSGYASNAALFINSYASPISNVMISGNYLNGGNYTVKIGVYTTGVTMKDNLFGRNYRYGTHNVKPGTTTWTNNRWADTLGLIAL